MFKVTVEFQLPVSKSKADAQARVQHWLDHWLEQAFMPSAQAKVTFQVTQVEEVQ